MEKKLLRKIAASFFLAEGILICIFSMFFYRYEIKKKSEDSDLVLNQFEAAYERAEERQVKKQAMYAVDYLNRASVVDYILGKNPEMQDTAGLKELSRQMDIELLLLLDRDGRVLAANTPGLAGAELLANDEGADIRQMLSEGEPENSRMILNGEGVLKEVPSADYVVIGSEQEAYGAVFIGIGEEVREGVQYAANVGNVLGSVPCIAGQSFGVIDAANGQVLGCTTAGFLGKQVDDPMMELLRSAGEQKLVSLNGSRVLLTSRTFQDMLLVSTLDYYGVLRTVFLQIFICVAMLLLIFLVLIAVVKRYFRRYVFSEFQMIENTVRDLLRGKEGTEFQTTQGMEMQEVVETLNKLIHINNELKVIAEDSEKDSITGLLNRKGVEKYMENYRKLPDQQGVMLMMDIDNFKAVNDNKGHPEGDHVLKIVADCMREIFREDDVLGRLGGDEFVVYLNNVIPRERLEEMLETMLQRLRGRITDYYKEYHVSISIGAAVLTTGQLDYKALYQCADEALYEAKREGKDRYRIHVCGEAEQMGKEELNGGV